MKTQLTTAYLGAFSTKIAVVTLSVVALTASPAIAGSDVAMDNLNRVFNPTLISAPTSQGHSADTGRNIAYENIARIFDPGMLTAELSPVPGKTVSEDLGRRDIAQENIDRIFKVTAAE